MRLIDADVLLKKLLALFNYRIVERDYTKRIVDDMPTIEQKPIAQKHGHWDYYGYDEISNVHIYRCSECECGNGEATDCCPHCGAKMRGDNDV